MIHDCVLILPQTGAGDCAQEEHIAAEVAGAGVAGDGEGDEVDVEGVGTTGSALCFANLGSVPILRGR